MRLIRNGLYTIGTQGFGAILYLLATPFIVARMGATAYGIYTITLVFSGYLALFDLGLSNAIIRALSEGLARRDTGYMRRVVSTSIVAYLVIGALLSGLFALAAPLLVDHLLKIPSALHGVALTTFYLAALNVGLGMFGLIFPAAVTALQRFDLFFWRNLIFTGALVFGTIAILWAGHGLRAVMAYTVVLSLASLAIWAHLYNKLLPEVPLGLSFDPATFRGLFNYGVFKLIAGLANYAIAYTDQIVIGHFLAVVAVTYYAIPSSIGQNLSGLQLAFIPLFPVMVERWATGQQESFRRGFITSTRYLALLLLPVAGILFVFADKVLLYWVGPVFAARSTGVLRLLVVAYLLHALSATANIAADALGRPGVQSAFYTCSCLTNIALMVLLTPTYGIVGAATAFLLNTLVQNTLFMLYVSKRVAHVSLVEMLHGGYGRPVVAALGAGAITALCRSAVGNGLPLVAACGLLYLALYCVLSVALGAVQREEVLKLKEWTTVKLARAGSA